MGFNQENGDFDGYTLWEWLTKIKPSIDRPFLIGKPSIIWVLPSKIQRETELIYPLGMTNSLLLKIAIDIVDFPIKNGDFP